MVRHTETHTTKDIYGQYASDTLLTGAEGHMDATGTLDVRGSGSIGFHNTGLWDEELTTVPDEATGEVDHVEGEFDALTVETGIGAQALDAAMGMDDDAAAHWLAEHDS